MDQTRFPHLFALLVGPDADAEERAKAALIRAKALEELQEAQRRRDSRRKNKAQADAIEATRRALEAGV